MCVSSWCVCVVAPVFIVPGVAFVSADVFIAFVAIVSVELVVVVDVAIAVAVVASVAACVALVDNASAQALVSVVLFRARVLIVVPAFNIIVVVVCCCHYCCYVRCRSILTLVVFAG